MPLSISTRIVKWRTSPLAWAAAVGIVTSGGVSIATPDGNLVVTLVPGLVTGLVAWLLARQALRRRARQHMRVE
jgi:hypothetical protein